MNRRNFLKGFLAATGTLAVAPASFLKGDDLTKEIIDGIEFIRYCTPYGDLLLKSLPLFDKAVYNHPGIKLQMNTGI